MKKKLLIDAISTSSGGAISHLKIILKNFKSQKYFSEVDVFIPYKTMLQMPANKNINYITNKFFEKNLFLRIIWQVLILNFKIKFNKYDCIFVTGSSHLLFSKNIVTISQNLLPFSRTESEKYFLSFFYIKLKLLKFTQKISFKLSKGIIFLHEYSKNKILKNCKNINSDINVIAHSIDLKKKNINVRRHNRYRLIYISNIDYYKNQNFIIESINDLLLKKPELKKKIKVEFYGNYYPPALKDMKNLIKKIPNGNLLFKYFGLFPRKKIYKYKKGFNTISLFASSCENFSVSLLESMAVGLPILCVDLQPMKSVLGNSGFFYKHESKKSFQTQLLKMIKSQNSFKKKTSISVAKAKIYNPTIMASKTYKFLNKISEY